MLPSSILIKNLENDSHPILEPNIEIEIYTTNLYFPYNLLEQNSQYLNITDIIKYNEEFKPYKIGLSINNYNTFMNELLFIYYMHYFSLQNLQKPNLITSNIIKTQLGKYNKINHLNKCEENCPICMNNYKLHEGYRILKCDHMFHKKCIDKWFLKGNHNNCPLCRIDIIEL